MFKRLSFLVLFFCGSVFASTSKDVIIRTDKFTGYTATILKEFGVYSFADNEGKLVQLSLSALHSTKDGKITLAVYSWSGRFQFSGGADVFALVDGERIPLGHFAVGKSEITSHYADEFVAGLIDRETLGKLANGKSVQMRVGSMSFTLKDKHTDKLKEFAAAIPQ